MTKYGMRNNLTATFDIEYDNRNRDSGGACSSFHGDLPESVEVYLPVAGKCLALIVYQRR